VAVPEFLVERYETGLEVGRLRLDRTALDTAAATMRSEGHVIELLDLTLVPADGWTVARLRCGSAQTVALLHERASVPYERISEAIEVGAGATERGAEDD
jgi:hypothetical protein